MPTACRRPGRENNERNSYSRSVVCNALDELVTPIGLVTKRASFRGNDEYIVNGYACSAPGRQRPYGKSKSSTF